MEQGHGSPAATSALNSLYAGAMSYTPADGRGTAVFAEVLHQLDLMTQARRERLVLASGIVPGIIWLVLFAGAFLTLGFTFFFGAENLLAQTMMTGALSRHDLRRPARHRGDRPPVRRFSESAT